MKDFSGFDNTSGAFPDVVATNSSGPTLRDGTPITATVVNDIWGAFQAILNSAGVTPSDVVEADGASDLLDSIRKVAGAPGEVVLHASPSESIDARILPLKGQVITIATYPDLVAATYIGDANNANIAYPAFFKTSDSGGTTRDTAGSYFVLPDCRGSFLRALPGAKTGVDKGRDYLTSTFGSDYSNMCGYEVADSPGWHTHQVEASEPSDLPLTLEVQYVMTSSPGVITGASGGVLPVARNMYTGLPAGDYDVGTEIANLGGTDYSTSGTFYNEVRPRNFGFHLGIRY